ncbi:MAG TPA: MFS transporter [Steroidobacteraceae bacterium]|nr:MFS transporter [Steroidobacteraceae bacterium]
MNQASPTAPQKAIPASYVVAVFVGNGLEFYDFLSYALFAVYIGRAFFPSSNGALSLLLSLATFGIGFVTRPLGGIVLGTLGDRIGRKPAMLISFMLMGVGMLGLALTPSYARIGIAAPILAVLFRLIQGFALGGEVGPTTAYMVEAAPPNRRGLYGSMQYLTQDAANLLAALVGVTLSSTLSPQHLQDWGWRIAFLLGVIIVPFGMFLRDRLPETLHAADDAALAPDATLGALGLSARIAPYLPIIAFGLVLLSSGTIGSYVLEYLTTYALNTLHLSAGVSFGLVVVTSICAIIFDPISGALSDRYGRRRIIIVGFTLTLVSVFPAFWIVNRYPSAWIVYAMMGLIAALFALGTPPIIVALTEALPKKIRAGVVATTYAFAISVFGGSTQFVIAWLIQRTGNPLAPAWYWMGALLLGLTAAALMPETAPERAGAAAPLPSFE